MKRLLVVMAACQSKKDAPPPPPHVPAPIVIPVDAARPVAKCEVAVDANHDITVDGVKVLSAGDIEHADGVKPVVYPRGDHLLVAFTAPGHYGGYAGSSEIIDVPCANPKGSKVMFGQPGGDFGHSTIIGDTLYFSDGPGIYAYDLATQQRVWAVTNPPKAGKGCNAGDDHQLNDVILGYRAADDAISFARGGPCGFEGDWEETRLYLDHPTTPGKPRPARPVAAVAKDAGGGLWASTGACVASLARSTDGGATWKRVAAKLVTAPNVILPDAKDAARVVVHTAPCGADAGPAGWRGDTLAATRDGGATWKAIAFPKELSLGEMASGDDHARLDTALALRDGSADKLTLSATDDEKKKTVWTSDDAGATWKMDATATAPAAPPAVAGWEPSPDGLLHDGKHVYIP